MPRFTGHLTEAEYKHYYLTGTRFAGRQVLTFLRFLRGLLFEMNNKTELALRSAYARFSGEETFEQILADTEATQDPEHIMRIGLSIVEKAEEHDFSKLPRTLPACLSNFLFLLHDNSRAILEHFEVILTGSFMVSADKTDALREACQDLIKKTLSPSPQTSFGREEKNIYFALREFCRTISSEIDSPAFSKYADFFDPDCIDQHQRAKIVTPEGLTLRPKDDDDVADPIPRVLRGEALSDASKACAAGWS